MKSDVASSYYTYSINGMSMSELNVVMIYGIGALILVIIPVFVIAVYEMKQVKQSSQGGLDVILSGLGKIFIYSILFLFMVMLIMMALIGLSSSSINPAYGVDQFFHVDWLNEGVMASLDNSTISNLGNVSKLESAKAMVAILSLFRFIYILLLMAFFLISMSFATSIVFADHKKGNDNSTLSFLLHMFVATVMSVLVFWALVDMISQVLNAMLWFSDETQNTSYGGNEINIMNDLVALFTIGLDYIESSLGGG